MFFSAFDDTGDKIRGQMEDVARMYAGIGLPTLSDTDFRPESMDYELIQEDPGMRQAQMRALEKMATLANEGLTAEDNLAMNKAQDMAGGRARMAREAALQNAQARGVAGGGLEFGLSEIANQEAAERARQRGMEQAAASARQRALNQMAHMQGLGGLRDQDYRAGSANTGIINNFNAMNTQNRNQANLRNIDQRRANEQQRFQNALGRADGMAGAKKGMADAYAAEGAQRSNDFNTAIQTGAILASDEGLKTDVRNADHAVREVFDNLSPYLWVYKNPKFGEGEYVGVMAQDLEKSSAGKNAVMETPEGKMVDTQKIIPMMMAAITSQQKRINELEAKLG